MNPTEVAIRWHENSRMNTGAECLATARGMAAGRLIDKSRSAHYPALMALEVCHDRVRGRSIQ